MMVNKTTERALLARPLVFVLGAAASAFVNPSLRTGPLLLWVAGIFGGINLALWMLRDRRFFSRLSVLGSPVVALLGWAIVATFTGGLESPFVAAFFFEIILAGVSMGPRGVLWVTANSIVILALIQILPYGFKDGWQLLVLEGMFVAAIGGLGAAMARRRRVGERALRTQSENLGQRLESLQRELEDERVISRVGENVARLAHGLKNAVHSLRGFVGLIEPHLERGAGTNAAMAGLRAAIDDLEKLARLTLAENGPASAAQTAAGATSGAVATAPDRVSRGGLWTESADR
jgi:hypothetical protein